MGVPERKNIECDAWGNPVKQASGKSALWEALFSFFALLLFICILAGFSESKRRELVRLSEEAEEAAVSLTSTETKPKTGEELYDFLFDHREIFSIGAGTLLEADPYDYEDEKFYCYDEYIDDSVPYSVSRCAWEYNNKDGYAYGEDGGFPGNFYADCEYLKVSDTGLDSKSEAYINDVFYANTCIVADMYQAYSTKIPDGKYFCVQVMSCVPYMDEDVFSVIMIYDGYMSDDTASFSDGDYIMSSILAFNFDMKTGELLDIYDSFTPDSDFVDRFFDSAMEQTGEDIAEYMSKEEVLSEFSYGYLEWFFTPVGIELAYNYPGFCGFTSVTEFDRYFWKK